jgi:hypothetical protein
VREEDLLRLGHDLRSKPLASSDVVGSIDVLLGNDRWTP